VFRPVGAPRPAGGWTPVPDDDVVRLVDAGLPLGDLGLLVVLRGLLRPSYTLSGRLGGVSGRPGDGIVDALARAARWTPDAVRRALRRLEAAGLVVREKGNRGPGLVRPAAAVAPRGEVLAGEAVRDLGERLTDTGDQPTVKSGDPRRALSDQPTLGSVQPTVKSADANSGDYSGILDTGEPPPPPRRVGRRRRRRPPGATPGAVSPPEEAPGLRLLPASPPAAAGAPPATRSASEGAGSGIPAAALALAPDPLKRIILRTRTRERRHAGA
jgi:hypothetical protein